MLKKFLPKVPEYCVVPNGFSIRKKTGQLLIKIPIPLVYKQYSVQYRKEVWGCPHLLYAPWLGIQIWWLEIDFGD